MPQSPRPAGPLPKNRVVALVAGLALGVGFALVVPDAMLGFVPLLVVGFVLWRAGVRPARRPPEMRRRNRLLPKR